MSEDSTPAQGKQARDRRAEAVCSRCSSSGGCRQISRWSLVCLRGQEKKWPADILAHNGCEVLGAQVESGMVSEQAFTYASEAGKAHCAANAKAARAAMSSCAGVIWQGGRGPSESTRFGKVKTYYLLILFLPGHRPKPTHSLPGSRTSYTVHQCLQN